MAWLAYAAGDEPDARATLAEALPSLDAPEQRARVRRALDAMSAAQDPPLAERLVAEMRAQLDHWAALDDELGREMAQVLPCAQFARVGAPVIRAFRPLGDARSDDDAMRFVERCGLASIDALGEDGGASAVQAAVRALGDGAIGLATGGDADATPVLDARARTRLVEPWFVPSFQDTAATDAALLRLAGERGAPTRAAAVAWLRARSSWIDEYGRGLCARATGSAVMTPAQCRSRAQFAANAAAIAALTSSAE